MVVETQNASWTEGLHFVKISCNSKEGYMT